MTYNVAVVGATGNVGREMLKILDERGFPVKQVHALASRHYAFEGRCFVLAAGLVQHRDDLFEGLALAGGDVTGSAGLSV